MHRIRPSAFAGIFVVAIVIYLVIRIGLAIDERNITSADVPIGGSLMGN
jgi:hypothetical protein